MKESISQDEILRIISLDEEPILRNLKITQCYSDLSRAIARRLGEQNANWCTFAMWASKTAGRFIRLEELDIHLHKALHASNDYKDWLLLIQAKYQELDISRKFNHDNVNHAAQSTFSLISADIAAGNLKVFSEIAPAFSRMIHAFDQSLDGNKQAIDSVIRQLNPGETLNGGQDMLQNAILDFHEALHEKDRVRKAELILRANAQTGLHEQIRLQPYIAGAMGAPVHQVFYGLLHGHIKDNSPKEHHHRLQHLFGHLISSVANKVNETWLNICTHYLMTLILPDAVLHMGHDIPQPKDGPLFPKELQDPQDSSLKNILKQFNAHPNATPHSKAKNWADLNDRMHFILNLFRSRQQHQPLHINPFDKLQEEHIRKNIVPSGKL